MKANFALSLSFDGIKLLHREAGGWRRVGEVAVDVPDLPDALAELRANALALEPDGLASKLIIPSGQIKYLTIDNTEPDAPREARRDAAAAALEGVTPYPVADLAFDISPDGAQTHVAAVALETLAEAESFAVQFAFNPIAWVAVPGDAPFLGEPFFGQTAYADTLLPPGETVEPDGVAVVEIGDATIPPDTARDDTSQTGSGDAESAEASTSEPEDRSAEANETVADGLRGGKIDTDTDPEAGFASRRRAASDSAAPALGGAQRTPAPGEIIAGSIPDLDPAPPPDTGTPEQDMTTPALAAASLRKPVPADAPPGAASTEASTDKSPEPKTRGLFGKRTDPKNASLPSRKTQAQIAAADAKAAAKAARESEQERLTVFGARKSNAAQAPQVGGKPRYLGLMLTMALLLFLAGVAAWAALYVEDGVARFFAQPAEERMVDDAIDETELAAEPEPDATSDPAMDALLAAAPPPREITAAAPEAADISEEAAAHAFFEATGIWTLSPPTPAAPRAVSLNALYDSSLDPEIPALDAVALPPLPQERSADVRPPQIFPLPRGTRFDLDARGLVVPTPEGALSPEGIMVFTGPPPVVQPVRPAPPPQEEGALPDAEEPDRAFAEIRPRTRPAALIENAERQRLGGLTFAELAELTPRTRPESEKAAAEADETPTENAVAQSLRPDTRPEAFASLVAAARAAQQQAAAESPAAQGGQTTATARASAPASTAPAIPTRASVAEQATVRRAINLRRLNLIGVSGTPSDRTALVRLENGRYRSVQVGDRLDGGRVSAIGESELRYQKNGRNIALRMPRS